MFTYNERDLHRMPTPARSHLPMKDFILASGILDDETMPTATNDADVALLRLPAPSLRGTFAKAYALLAKLVSQIGWDELLKCRSLVFVMEEEYRAQKSADPTPEIQAEEGGGAKRNGKGKIQEEEKEGFGPLAVEGDSADEDASVKAIAPSTPSIIVPPTIPSFTALSRENSSTSIPTIKVSTDSDGERERSAVAELEAEATNAANGELQKPSVAQQGEEEKSTSVPAPSTSESAAAAPGSFSNKRLCERWLDNLFMVLYEVRHPFSLESNLANLSRRISESTRSGEQK